MKKSHKILLGACLLWMAGYVLFIWGRLPGQYDPTQLGGKGLPTGNQFVCGWNWRSPLLLECDAQKFFYDSFMVYTMLTIYFPLALVFGFFIMPFLLVTDHLLWPVGIFAWAALGGIIYIFYRRYKRKPSSISSAHDPHSPKDQKQ